jgi:hypothetical protein
MSRSAEIQIWTKLPLTQKAKYAGAEPPQVKTYHIPEYLSFLGWLPYSRESHSDER